MIVKEIKDAGLIKDVLSTCYTDIKNDSDPDFDDLEPSLEGRKYLGGFVNGELIGIAVYCYQPGRTSFHIVVKPEYRGKYAGSLTKRALNYRKGTIFTEIPDLYQNVVRFAQMMGFEIIGRSKSSTINGISYVVNEMRLD